MPIKFPESQAISDGEVQGEFMGMRSEPDGIDLLFAFVVEPDLNHVH